MKRRMLSVTCLLCGALAVACAAPAGGAPPAGPAAEPAAPARTPRPGGTAANAAAGKPDASVPSLIEQVRQNRRRLTAAVISAPEPATDDSELREAVERVRSITLKQRPVLPDSEPTPKTEMPAPEAPAPARNSGSAILPPEKLEQLKALPANQVTDPVALADALFRSGHYDHAYTFYEQMLADATTGEPTRAWLLFQMANCKRQSDPAAAVALYGRLLTGHPESSWAGPGKAYKTLVEWRQAVKPEAILESLQAPPPEPASKGKAE